MSTIDLETLSMQVDQLIQTAQKQQMENASLRQKIAVLSQEKARLLHKSHTSAKRLKQIIKQIKEEMHGG